MMPPMREPPGQTLLVDADDTLWENEAHFRHVWAWFLDRMESRGHERDHALDTLRAVERARCARFGYGALNFALSIVDAVADMEGHPCPKDLEEAIHAQKDWILDRPVEPFPRVDATLADLKQRHRLIIVTKGVVDEQSAKIERSGLAHHFEAAEVVAEKDIAHYTDVIERHGIDLATGWMIGNSPKSDINRSRAAGLKTVFIPHRTIWELEREPFPEPPGYTLERFHQLLDHF